MGGYKLATQTGVRWEVETPVALPSVIFFRNSFSKFLPVTGKPALNLPACDQEGKYLVGAAIRIKLNFTFVGMDLPTI